MSSSHQTSKYHTATADTHKQFLQLPMKRPHTGQFIRTVARRSTMSTGRLSIYPRADTQPVQINFLHVLQLDIISKSLYFIHITHIPWIHKCVTNTTASEHVMTHTYTQCYSVNYYTHFTKVSQTISTHNNQLIYKVQAVCMSVLSYG
jgi:hypothetical protein